MSGAAEPIGYSHGTRTVEASLMARSAGFDQVWVGAPLSSLEWLRIVKPASRSPTVDKPQNGTREIRRSASREECES